MLSLLLVGAVPVLTATAAEADRTTDPSMESGPGAVTAYTIDATGPSQLVAYGPDGERIYRERTFDIYHDVDPSSEGARTVTYVASEGVDPSRCAAEECIRNVVRRVNLTTGESERLYSVVSPRVGSSQIHDVDRVNESVLLVADIRTGRDGVYMVNTTTDEVIWEWRVREAYAKESGGKYPGDWSHLNDVEYLDDGRVMASLRNMDEVVFIEPGEGMLHNWTLGEDDNRSILYEQHNPDYIPRERGGPAVVVADSENNRIVEYQRENGTWTRTWRWRDARLRWPRDADRLPNGNTVLVDSHGNRIFAVNETGSVVWRADVPDGVYDAEVLPTGDESTGGESAARLDYADRRVTLADGPASWLTVRVTSLVPSVILNGALFALPGWVSAAEAVGMLFQLLVVVGWAAVEAALVWTGRKKGD
ncbi:arylsulfotransferase family protein [Halopelagius fulvigenes]|uniref:Arylsulfotransferase family protein n=1 Tax=Halopelagius fulvigenes TaxID=1198324 RepID=A0ABD5TXK1_9EURY